jgi:L-alanine-DL-glutamate epimerase-like enolase superfamily enzyme
MRIRDIEAIPIRVPLAEVFSTGATMIADRWAVVVRVRTDAAITGEAVLTDVGENAPAIAAVVERDLLPRLVGEDPRDRERCRRLALAVTVGRVRRRRAALAACSGVDAALWDAIGKAVDQPLWRLWGGRAPEVPLVCIGGYYGAPVALEQEVAEIRDAGLAGMKLIVGGLSPEEDADRVRRARAAGGPEFLLCADAGEAWTAGEAARFAAATKEYNLRWIEEPCDWTVERSALRELRVATGARICAGRSEPGFAACRDLMLDDAIDVCSFSVTAGGPTAWLRVAELAADHAVAMAHHEAPQLALHLLAATPDATHAECFTPERDPVWWYLVANRPVLRDGRVTLSDRPGFGWELDTEYLAYHRIRAA